MLEDLGSIISFIIKKTYLRELRVSREFNLIDRIIHIHVSD
jgi:hypothetical protein